MYGTKRCPPQAAPRTTGRAQGQRRRGEGDRRLRGAAHHVERHARRGKRRPGYLMEGSFRRICSGANAASASAHTSRQRRAERLQRLRREWRRFGRLWGASVSLPLPWPWRRQSRQGWLKEAGGRRRIEIGEDFQRWEVSWPANHSPRRRRLRHRREERLDKYQRSVKLSCTLPAEVMYCPAGLFSPFCSL